MRIEPNIASMAATIGEPSRAAMLMALLDGRALPAGELAYAAGLSAQSASGHLAKLVGSRLLSVEREGRHRYYRLAGPQVAAALESLAILAGRPPVLDPPRSSKARALRYARSCYDHLAGELGVATASALESRGFLVRGQGKRFEVSAAGREWFRTLGIDVEGIHPGRHGIARACLDWTERRHHLAGPLGTRLLARCCELGWLERSRASRLVRVTPLGRGRLRAALEIEVAQRPS